ncbi:hypothetical protein ACKI2C_51085, partial [Streptomyces brasiliscabiei]|uniref:hypothetical protein n=1 Tax=Streptomyces brasiliscabiei TaxID=2736302 RepID=UPI0038F6542C
LVQLSIEPSKIWFKKSATFVLYSALFSFFNAAIFVANSAFSASAVVVAVVEVGLTVTAFVEVDAATVLVLVELFLAVLLLEDE